MIGCQSFIKGLSQRKFHARLILFIVLGLLNLFHSYEAAAVPYALNCRTRPSLPPGFTMLPSGGTPGSTYTGFTDRFVGCLEDAVVTIGVAQFTTIRTQLRNTVVITLALFIIFFTYRAMFANQGSSQRDNFIIMVFKLTAVSAACFGMALNHFFPTFIYAQQWLVQTVTSSLSGGPPCDIYLRVWQRIDCSVGNMFGATLYTGPGNQTIAPFVPGARTPWILLSFILSNLFSSTLGFPMLFVTIVLMLFLLFAFAAAALNYLMSLIALVILFLFAPAMIPLVLFEATQQMFYIWLRLLFAYTVQPMLLFAYIAFMVFCVNYIVIGPGGAGVTAGGIVVNDTTPVGMMQFLNATMNNFNAPGFSTSRNLLNADARVEDEGAEECANNSGSNTPGRVQTQNDFKLSIPDFTYIRQPGNYCFRESDYRKCVMNAVFMNLVILLIMSLILLAFMGTVIDFGNDLAGMHGENFANRFNFNKRLADAIKKKATQLNKAVTSAVMAIADAKTGGAASKVKGAADAVKGAAGKK